MRAVAFDPSERKQLFVGYCCQSGQLRMTPLWKWFAFFTLCHHGSLALFHEDMNKEELHTMFHTHDPEQVDSDSYTVVPIKRESVLAKRSESNVDMAISLDAFGRNYHLNMVKNKHIVSDDTTVTMRKAENTTVEKMSPALQHCFYMVEDTHHYGGISTCNDRYEGYFMDGQKVMEIQPLPERLAHKLRKSRKKRSESLAITEEDEPIQQFFMVKRSNLSEFRSRFGEWEKHITHNLEGKESLTVAKRSVPCSKTNDLYLELGLTVDKPAVDLMIKEKNLPNANAIQGTVLLIVNGMNAIYHHKTLGRKVNFIVKDIEIQEDRVEIRNDDREKLLRSFCEANLKKNSNKEYDMGVLFSGHDMYAMKGNQKSTSTMGLSAVGTVCLPAWSCVIGELGVRDHRGEAYPSTGFNAVYIIGHEIGHNIGLHHDGYEGGRKENDKIFRGCAKDGFVMSPTRGPEGETPWSSCSRDFLCNYIEAPCMEEKSFPNSKYDHFFRYGLTPGMYYTPNQHCSFLMGSDGAQCVNKNMEDICDKGVRCEIKALNRIEYGGPVLQGTPCGNGRTCMDNECTLPAGRQAVLEEPSWGPWKESSGCQGGCVTGSKGFQLMSRDCIYGDGALAGDCVGPTTKVELCDNPDSSQCTAKGSAQDYANQACGYIKANFADDFGKWINGEGFQKDHDDTDANRACQVYCKASRGGSKSPAEAMTKHRRLDLGYLPDGTPCHDVSGTTFYCMERKCTNPNGRGQRASGKDRSVVTMVNPDGTPNTDDSDKYFTLDENGEPLSKDLPDEQDGSSIQFPMEDGIDVGPL